MNNNIYPSQRTSYEEKKSYDFRKKQTDYILGCANFGGKSYLDMKRIYRALEGELDFADYNHVLNPLNSTDPDLLRHQAKIRNYPILSPIVDLYQGELSKMPSNYTVVIKNGDTQNRYLESLNEAYYAEMEAITAQAIKEKRLPTEEENQRLQALQQIHKDSWKDNRAIFGQEAVDVFKDTLELNDKEQELLSHWVKVGRYYTKRGINYHDLTYDVLHPLDVAHSYVATGYVEHNDWFVWREKISYNTLVTKYRDWFPKSDMEDLEKILIPSSHDNTAQQILDQMNNEWFSGEDWFNDSHGGYTYIYHIEYTTLIKTGILTYSIDGGEPQQRVVDETYELDIAMGDISIRWEWLAQKWETKKVKNCYGDNRPVLVQRDDLDNTSAVTSSYGGRIINSTSGKIMSQMEVGLPFQILYNIYNFKREQLINKNRNKFTFFPTGLIPKSISAKSAGKDPFEVMMYYLESLDFMFFDESKNKRAVELLQYIKQIDLSLGNYIEQLTGTINNVKSEYWDTIGMNRQRWGDTFASDGKGSNEQAIFRSSLVTAEMYRKFKKGQEKDVSCLMDYSKVAWSEGYKRQYMTSDGFQKFFEVNPETHINTNYAIFAVDSVLEKDKIDKANAVVDRIAQNPNTKTSTILEVFDTNNFSKLKSIALKAEEDERAYQQAIEENKNKAMVEAEKIIADNAQKERDVKVYIADADNLSNEKIALLNTHKEIVMAKTDSASTEGNEDQDDAEKDMKERELALKERAQAFNEKAKEKELKIKQQVANKPRPASK